jgi:hypothetical protein
MPMSAHVLVTGTLFRPPEQRTSKAHKRFVTATIRAKDGDESQWWKVLAFSESIQAELMRLADGDTISVQGAFKAELYDKAGKSGSRCRSSPPMSWLYGSHVTSPQRMKRSSMTPCNFGARYERK